MNIKEFTESTIALFLSNGGFVHPDVTLDIFKFIENDESLMNDYLALSKHYKEVNPTIGKTIRQYFDLRNEKTMDASGKCKLIKNYMRFHKK